MIEFPPKPEPESEPEPPVVAEEEIAVAVTGQTVVDTTMTSVVIYVDLSLAGQSVTVDGQAVIVAVRVEKMVEVVDPAPPDSPWGVLEPDPPPGAVVMLEETPEDEPFPLSVLLEVVDAVVEEAAEVAATDEDTALVEDDPTPTEDGVVSEDEWTELDEDVLVLVLHGLDEGRTLVEDGLTLAEDLTVLDDGLTLVEDDPTPDEDDAGVAEDAMTLDEDDPTKGVVDATLDEKTELGVGVGVEDGIVE